MSSPWSTPDLGEFLALTIGTGFMSLVYVFDVALSAGVADAVIVLPAVVGAIPLVWSVAFDVLTDDSDGEGVTGA